MGGEGRLAVAWRTIKQQSGEKRTETNSHRGQKANSKNGKKKKKIERTKLQKGLASKGEE